jgi:multidrug efflux pump subunit AcrB
MNMRGNLIPVGKMIRAESGEGLVAINHLDGKRLITVTANLVETKLSAARAAVLINEQSGSLIREYPGYAVQFGGENKDTQESMMSLGKAFLVGFIIIFMILASLFKSLLQPFVVMGAIPFSLMGVILAFLVNGWLFDGIPIPLSFMSMMGIIGLAGVVVNDSIVLVDFANNIKEENPELSSEEVAERAGGMRLRAVMLTTITTVLGLLPTAYGIGGDDPFLRPMALAFSWGLLFSTLLTLIIIPVQYSILIDITTYVKRKLKLVEH